MLPILKGIYQLPEPQPKRSRPLRVICLGLPRSGTESLKSALETLGFGRVAHGFEWWLHHPNHSILYCELLLLKLQNRIPSPKVLRERYFDRLLGDTDASTDVPTVWFATELLQAYPDAKIIITTRDANSWFKSANKTVFKFVQMPIFRLWQYLDTTSIGPLFRMSELVWKVFCENCYDEGVLRRAYHEHHERLRNAIPKEQLLEFRTGRDGWEELCGFLEVPVPQEPWPKAYPAAEFEEHIAVARREALWTMTRWLGRGLAVVGVVSAWSYIGPLWRS